MRLIDGPEVRQKFEALQLEVGKDGEPVQVDTVPGTKAARDKLLKDLQGHWVVSTHPAVKALLIGAGWSHRGVYGCDIYHQR
jgi:hypothetical protein